MTPALSQKLDQNAEADLEMQRSLLADDMAAANINPQTCLATDYLNHYNEIVMLLEMMPDMPEMVEEALEWQPKTYQQHFRDSAFKGKDLAIEVYDIAPTATRLAFEETCTGLDNAIAQLLKGLIAVGAGERGLSAAAQGFVRARIKAVQDDLMLLNQVIHGKQDDADMVDMVADQAAPQDDDDQAAQTQADIDKLFD